MYKWTIIMSREERKRDVSIHIHFMIVIVSPILFVSYTPTLMLAFESNIESIRTIIFSFCSKIPPQAVCRLYVRIQVQLILFY